MSALVLLTTGVFLYLLFKSLSFFVPRWNSPLNHLRGPPNASLLFGHFKELDADNSNVQARWFAEYGSTMRTYGIFKVSGCLKSEALMIGADIVLSLCYRFHSSTPPIYDWSTTS